MPTSQEDVMARDHKLVVTREPVGPGDNTSPGSVGNTALNDALLLIIASWAVVLGLYFSLRRHNA